MAAVKTQGIRSSRTKTLPLKKIRLDGDTQSRLSLSDELIHQYAALMKDGHIFPPLLVVFDGADYWLVDGFHRRWSAIKAGIDKLKCEIVEGTREDARWLSYGVNKDHGLPRTNEDKKKAVIAALKHPTGAKKSDTAIAAHVGVDQKTVLKYRQHLEVTKEVPKSPERTGRDGRTINTENIGKSKAPERFEGLDWQTDCVVTMPRKIEKSPEKSGDSHEFTQLCHWWEKADSAARARFRLWIDGEW